MILGCKVRFLLNMGVTKEEAEEVLELILKGAQELTRDVDIQRIAHAPGEATLVFQKGLFKEMTEMLRADGVIRNLSAGILWRISHNQRIRTIISALSARTCAVSENTRSVLSADGIQGSRRAQGNTLIHVCIAS